MKNTFNTVLSNLKAPFRWLGVLFLLPLFSFAQFEDDDHRVLSEFIVMLKPTHTIEQLLSEPVFAGRLSSKECLSPRMNIYLLERNTTVSPEEFLFTLKQNEHVKLAQFNHRIKERALIPNDTRFNQQWNMMNTGQLVGSITGIPGADIEATEAWAIDTGNITANGDTIVVAVIDGKFDLSHEDLNYFTNYNEVPGNGIDDDGNGYIDDVNGWNVYDNNGDVGTSSVFAAHATHCAGIVGAIGNNGKGVAGVCWGVKILPVAGSSSDEAEVVQAYDYVRTMRMLYNNTFGTQGAFVVSTNSSFGEDNGNPVNFPIWCAMYDSMGYVGILSAGATANANTNVDVQHDIPTECPSPWLVSVTNTMPTDAKNANSGYGKQSIDLGAPGYLIQSTIPSNLYTGMTGTSMSTPHVAGAIAAMYAAACKSLIDRYHEQPDSIALLVKEYLLDAAEWVSSMNNITSTNGRLNLYRAITNLKKYNCDSCNFNIAIDKIPISCKSAGDGALAVSTDSGSIFNYSILWSNGLTFPECLTLEPGFYTVTVVDSTKGCRRFATAELHDPDSIVINSVITVAADSVNPGNIIVNASAGNDTLMYSLDGVTYQQTSTFSVPTNGSYTVYVKNSLGCVVQKNVVVSDVEETGELQLEISIYPNPATDEFTVYCPQFVKQKTLLEVFDVTGRVVFRTTPSTSGFRIPVSGFANGIYFVKIGNSGRKLIISK